MTGRTRCWTAAATRPIGLRWDTTTLRKGFGMCFLYAIAALLLTISLKIGDDPVAAVALPLMEPLFATIAASFQHLTVADEGNRLLVHYGPLPLFRKRIWYDDLRHVEAGRTNILDGWGIHWIPGRGWTWNIWGFACVVIRLDRGTLRVGTDDPHGLVQFLRSRMKSSRTKGPVPAGPNHASGPLFFRKEAYRDLNNSPDLVASFWTSNDSGDAAGTP